MVSGSRPENIILILAISIEGKRLLLQPIRRNFGFCHRANWSRGIEYCPEEFSWGLSFLTHLVDLMDFEAISFSLSSISVVL